MHKCIIYLLVFVPLPTVRPVVQRDLTPISIDTDFNRNILTPERRGSVNCNVLAEVGGVAVGNFVTLLCAPFLPASTSGTAVGFRLGRGC